MPDVARLDPLGLYAIRSKLEEDGLLVPLLPPRDQMTPDDLLLVELDGTEQDFDEELAAWVASRLNSLNSSAPRNFSS